MKQILQDDVLVQVEIMNEDTILFSNEELGIFFVGSNDEEEGINKIVKTVKERVGTWSRSKSS